MISEPPNPHDAFFKQYLSHPQAAADFLRQHLPAEIVQLVDLTHLDLDKDSFVDDQLRSYFSDLVYRLKTSEQTPLAISLLFEHKSYPDEWVDFQVLGYKVQMWQQELKQIQAEQAKTKKTKNKRNAPKRKLTPILVLLVYHGKDEWKVSLRFARHLAGMEDPNSQLSRVLARYVPDFEPHLVDLTGMSDEVIQGEVATRLFVLVLKHIFEHGLGGRLNEILEMAAEVMRQPSGMEMVVALLRYIGRAGIQVSKDEVAQKLLEMLPTEGGMLMQTMAKDWIEEGKAIGIQLGLQEGRQVGLQEGRQVGLQEGRQVGLQEGRQVGLQEGLQQGEQKGEIQGRIKTQRIVILQVLRRRFLPNAELLQSIEEKVAQINDEETLHQLVDISLEVIVLPDFVNKLQKFIQPTD